MTLIDTHAHLYWDSFKEDFDEMIKRVLDAGVSTIINVGVDVEKSQQALDQAQNTKWPQGLKVFSTIGIHPHEALNYSGKGKGERVKLEEDINTLEAIYRDNPKKVVGVGECGLDYKENNSYNNYKNHKDYIKKQKKLFQAQIDLSRKLNLPLIVHCRDDRSQNPANYEAWDEVIDMVKGHFGILHCYSGLPKTTKRTLEETNFVISFAGNLTYPKNEYLHEATKLLPLDRIVLETDCPFLPPQSKRGRRNEPANIIETAKLLAEIKGITLQDLARQTTENVKIMFKL